MYDTEGQDGEWERGRPKADVSHGPGMLGRRDKTYDGEHKRRVELAVPGEGLVVRVRRADVRLRFLQQVRRELYHRRDERDIKGSVFASVSET